jgi:hypothetical protein
MGLSYTIDVKHGVVRTRGWGVITSREILDDTSRKLADPRFDPRFRSLFDMSEAFKLEISHGALAEVAATPVSMTACAAPSSQPPKRFMG